MAFRRVAPIVLVACLAAGCTSGGPSRPRDTPGSTVVTPPSSTVSPTSSAPSPTPTPSVATTGPNVRPGEKPPARSAVTRINVPAGALAATAYWIAALDWGYATTSTAAARDVFASSCVECVRLVGIVGRAANKQDHFRGGRISFRATRIVTADPRFGSSLAVDVTFDQSKVDQIGKTGQVIASEPAGLNRKYRTWLKFNSGRWTVVDFRQVVQR